MAAFPDIQKIKYEGPSSTNPLAFRWYNEREMVEGKSMKDQLRFSVAYWHTMRGTGSDPFGPGTMLRPWEAAQDSFQCLQIVRVAFEFMGWLSVFRSTIATLSPRKNWLRPAAIWTPGGVIKEEMQHRDRPLGHANLFSNPLRARAATGSTPRLAFAAAQVKRP